jgi:hypothetical protein
MSLETLLDRNKAYAGRPRRAQRLRRPQRLRRSRAGLAAGHRSGRGYVYNTAVGTLDTVVEPTAVVKR